MKVVSERKINTNNSWGFVGTVKGWGFHIESSEEPFPVQEYSADAFEVDISDRWDYWNQDDDAFDY